MKVIAISAAAWLAASGVAFAQTAPAPQTKPDCCEKMKQEGKKCCCDKEAGDDHAKHGEHMDHGGQ